MMALARLRKASWVSSRISRRSSQLALTHADESAVSRAEPAWPQLPVRLLPFRPRGGRVWSRVRDVAMLSERLAGAREVAALLQARVEVTQQRAADPAHFLDPSAGLIVRRI
jgi:hypothetical protein